MKKGRLYVISAPSGSGKTTLLQELLRTERRTFHSISVTTRSPRMGERNGRDYWFVTPDEFLRAKKKKEFLESARILGHWYGTPKKPIQRALAKDLDALLGLDIQGARQIRRMKLPATTIFILPPAFSVLRQRLERRGTETPEQIRARLNLARRELKAIRLYDYTVVNDRLREAVDNVRAILKAERCRTRR